MLTKNQTADVLIENCTPEGYGICRLEGRAVFVASALEGERWEILILKVTNSAVWAKGLRLLEASPFRCHPDCPNPCGGCSLRHMEYDEELRIKKAHVDDCLCRIGEQPTGTERIHGSPLTQRYRNKAIFAVDTVDGKAAFGFYRPRSHTLVPIGDCLLQSEECIQAAAAVVGFMNRNGIPAYEEATGKGVVRHIFWRESRRGDRVLCIVAARGFGTRTEQLTETLRSECPFLTGIVLNINKTKGNTVLAGDFHTLWGDPCVRETLCGNEFEIAPQAFLQINPPQAEALYDKAVEYATMPLPGREAAEKQLALDLYCGAGTVTLCLAKAFSSVIGAEIVPEAIENARENAGHNGVRNAEFVCADAAEIALRLRESGLKPDTVVVDPPRKGLEESVVRDICGMQPERVVYISCNPATLARDVERFAAEGYVMHTAEAYDMFPKTAHVETVVLMSRIQD
ncbi:MAG: 23S rRNA (uracil(1939)-C(5))-methyltransferase RlmD [Oscillospiraceae bacterium]|nr:23S rRNA (uracil(1939)-C(5))-methyltransferase RlmD [Oscillospiraceae bacterium]